MCGPDNQEIGRLRIRMGEHTVNKSAGSKTGLIGRRAISTPTLIGLLAMVLTASPAVADPALGCRASALRVSTGSATLSEPIVANDAGANCVTDEAPVAGPTNIDPGPIGGTEVPVIGWVEGRVWLQAGAAYARTDSTREHGGQFGVERNAEAGVTKLGMYLPAGVVYAYTYVDAATSSASAECVAGAAAFSSDSYVGRVRKPGVFDPDLEPLGSEPSSTSFPGGVIHFNYQSTTASTITRRAIFVDFTDPALPDLVVAESVASATGC